MFDNKIDKITNLQCSRDTRWITLSNANLLKISTIRLTNYCKTVIQSSYNLFYSCIIYNLNEILTKVKFIIRTKTLTLYMSPLCHIFLSYYFIWNKTTFFIWWYFLLIGLFLFLELSLLLKSMSFKVPLVSFASLLVIQTFITYSD